MFPIEEVLDNMATPPTLVNAGGEEIWHLEGSNMVFIRLKPGAKTDLYHHNCSVERYTVILGKVRFCYHFENFHLSVGQSITISPPMSHIAFNETNQVAHILGLVNIPWDRTTIL